MKLQRIGIKVEEELRTQSTRYLNLIIVQIVHKLIVTCEKCKKKRKQNKKEKFSVQLVAEFFYTQYNLSYLMFVSNFKILGQVRRPVNNFVNFLYKTSITKRLS